MTAAPGRDWTLGDAAASDPESYEASVLRAAGFSQTPPLGEVGHFIPLPTPIPADPYDEDGYCEWCGNGRWKYHRPECVWADADDASRATSSGPTEPQASG